MYVDESLARGVKRSVKDRLGAGFVSPSPASGYDLFKRQRQDIINRKYTYEREINHVTGNNVPKRLITIEMQKDVPKTSKNKINAVDIEKKALMITGTPKNDVPEETKAGSKLVSARKTAVQFASTPTTVEKKHNVDGSASKPVSGQKTAVQFASPPMSGDKKHVVVEELTVPAFLQKLGLSKYNITFQAEEVDMFALKHMNDDDLKSIGLPMGPRKKILIALAPKKAHK